MEGVHRVVHGRGHRVVHGRGPRGSPWTGGQCFQLFLFGTAGTQNLLH